MKKKIIWISIGIFIFLILVGIFLILRVRYAKIEVVLKSDLTVPIRELAKYSDFLVSINGNLLEDNIIDTSKLGPQTIEIHFKNEEHIKVKYQFNIEVVDKEPPIVWIKTQYTMVQGSSDDFLNKIMCADNYDAYPNCSIEGIYDMNTIGEYPLEFVAKDSSGNETRRHFKLNIIEKTNGGNSSNQNPPKTSTDFLEVVKNYKNENTEVGLDISHWQGDVDYQALKNAGVEFVILRVGTSSGIDGEYILDKKFIQNITNANEVGIPVGIYYYSYANSTLRAEQDAKWVLEQIKDYDVDLPIAFDWENWSFYNEFHLSLFGLSDMSEAFLKVINNAGYEGMLYSSKSYLEQIWYPTSYKTWLAHYTKETNYTGDYEYWQLCSDGVISGIKGDVDINIRYKK